MGILIWMMVGILLLAITIYVHKNTYSYYSEERKPFPVWLLMLMIVILLIPFVNLAAFILGAMVYFASIACFDIEFHCEARWWKLIKGFLCKEV